MNISKKNKKVLFAISSLGLGHATRTLPIIKFFKNKGSIITILSHDKSLIFLKKELKNTKGITFIDWDDYPKIGRGSVYNKYLYLLLDIFTTNKIIKKENRKFQKISHNYDYIYSDGKYGIYSSLVPSTIISHQIIFETPFFLKLFSFLSNLKNFNYLNKFDRVLIPDYNQKDNLAGKLSINKISKKLNPLYLGILSSYYNTNVTTKKEKQEIIYLFLISGYLNENKDSFVSKLVSQAKKLNGKKIFVLGESNKNYHKVDKKNNLEIYSYLYGEKMKNIFNKSDIIISRAGYTTIMDLIEKNKKAILFPTPNQTEQEYLAKFHKNKNNFLIANENDFSLKNLIKKTNNLNTNTFKNKTEKAIKKIDNISNNFLKNNIFNIILLIDNKESNANIEKIINSLIELKYKQRIITIIGYNLNTNIIKTLKNYTNKITLLQNNITSNNIPKSDWIIFIKINTILKNDDLQNLNKFLNKKQNIHKTAGIIKINFIKNDNFYKKNLIKNFISNYKINKQNNSIQVFKSNILLQNNNFNKKLFSSNKPDFVRIIFNKHEKNLFFFEIKE